MTITFDKYHANGNDFVIFDEDKNNKISDSDREYIARMFCQRNFSIGCDSVLFVKKINGKVSMRIFEKDGTESNMCGNGIRCVADYYNKEIKIKEILVLAGDNEIKKIKKYDNLYSVDMGLPKSLSGFIRNTTKKIIKLDSILQNNIIKKLELLELELENAYIMNIGEPHIVIFTEKADYIDLDKIGKILASKRDLFPKSININLTTIINNQTLRNRTYERGVFQETLSCGTGSVCAAYLFHTQIMNPNNEIKVKTKGGNLIIIIKEDNIKMIGDATHVFSGLINLQKPDKRIVIKP